MIDKCNDFSFGKSAVEGSTAGIDIRLAILRLFSLGHFFRKHVCKVTIYIDRLFNLQLFKLWKLVIKDEVLHYMMVDASGSEHELLHFL